MAVGDPAGAVIVTARENVRDEPSNAPTWMARNFAVMQLPVAVPPIGFRESVPTRPSVSNVTSTTVVPNGPLANAHSFSASAVASSIFWIASENGNGGKPDVVVAVGWGAVIVGIGGGFAWPVVVGCSLGFGSVVVPVLSGVSTTTVDVETGPELELEGSARKRKNATTPIAITANAPTSARTTRTVPTPDDFFGCTRGGGGAYAGVERGVNCGDPYVGVTPYVDGPYEAGPYAEGGPGERPDIWLGIWLGTWLMTGPDIGGAEESETRGGASSELPQERHTARPFETRSSTRRLQFGQMRAAMC